MSTDDPHSVPISAGTSTDHAATLLGSELSRIRKDLAKVNQEQMASRLGIATYSQRSRTVSTARATVSNFERGVRTPSHDVLARYLAMSDDPQATAELMAFLRPTQLLVSPPSEPAEPFETSRAARLVPGVDATAEASPTPRRRHLVQVALAALATLSTAALIIVVSRNAGDRAQRSLPKRTWTETTGSPAHTWSNYEQASGTAGTPLGPRQSVQVSCRVRGYVVPDGDPWWYRLESPPWNGRFYATSDAFYNQGSVSGPVDNGVVVDEQVPLC